MSTINRSRRGPAALFFGAGPMFVVLGVLAGGWYVVHQLDTGSAAFATQASAEPEAVVDGPLVLAPAKVAAAGLTIEPVTERPLQHVHTVPGRLRYNAASHVNVKAPVGGILVESLVKPGDSVEAGQLLAVINSPEIGVARADVLKRETELQLAQRRAEWQRQVTGNLRQLFQQLDAENDVRVVEESLTDKPLGTYRRALLSSWYELLLARRLAAAARPLARQGSIPARTLQERETQRQVADANFRAERDQAEFDARQDLDKAMAEVADAARRLQIARRHVETLLGYAEPPARTDASSALSRLEIRAPFAATLESLNYAPTERVAPGDSMFVLADTSTLYVEADIRENDWAATSLKPGQQIRVTAPAIVDQTFEATVHYIGREVDVATNSVPLVAILDNASGRLRPGMFVRVSVPMGTARTATAVRPQSLMQHDNQQFVFVALDTHKFQRVGVQTGLHTDEWIEVVSGLEPGQQVVSDGAFLLKSELLLEGEAE